MPITVTSIPTQKNVLIRSYGNGGFRIGESTVSGSVYISGQSVLPWAISQPEAISLEIFSTEFLKETRSKILIVGCGAKFSVPPENLRHSLKAQGIVLEWMTTGAGCRTFNVLLTENRPVSAALMAVE